MIHVWLTAFALHSAPAMAQMPSAGDLGNSMPEASALMKKVDDQAVAHLNSASATDLQKIPGVSSENAQAIVAARPFKSVADLKKVKGLSEAVIAKIKASMKM